MNFFHFRKPENIYRPEERSVPARNFVLSSCDDEKA
jgi:hypothetical protein